MKFEKMAENLHFYSTQKRMRATKFPIVDISLLQPDSFFSQQDVNVSPFELGLLELHWFIA